MPRMGNAESEHALAKVLLIGDGKCGKTDWAVRAVKAGFNLLYLDGDVARATIMNMVKESRITAEEANRIYLLAAGDSMAGGQRAPNFYQVVNELNSVVTYRWNDTQSREAKRTDADEIWEIKPARMDHKCVFVLDSWTSLTESISLAAAVANSVDLAEATTSEMRPVYQSAGLKATEMLQVIRSMRCHVIVIAHPDEYSHTTKPDGKKVGSIRETELTVDWTKMIPKSTSKPHSLQMGKYFTDILWLTTNATGSERIVDARISDGKMSGGHWADRKNTDEYSFANLVKQIGGELPGGEVPVDYWLTIIPAGTEQAPVNQVLDGTTNSTVKASGISGLMKKA